MSQRTHIDLFSGLGGFALAAYVNHIQTIVFCEANKECSQFLANTWGLPVEPDVKKFNGRNYPRPWLLTAGVPCQPASRDGEQRGEEDDRWLWPEAIRVCEECEPAWCLFENPPGILDVGIDGIIAQLEGRGYEVQPISVPACAVDSPQDRERIWILGHRTGDALGDAAEPGQQGHDAGNVQGEARRIAQPTQGEFMGYGQECNGGLPIQSGRQGIAGAESGGAVKERILAHGEAYRPQAEPPEGKPRVERTGGSEAVLANGASGAGHGRPPQPGRRPQRRDAAGRNAQSGVVANGNKIRQAEWCKQEPKQGPEHIATIKRAFVDNEVARSLWRDYEWIPCPNPKGGALIRRAPVGLYGMADGLSRGLPKGMGAKLIAALGNAIVWRVAAEIISAMVQAEEQAGQ